MLIHSEPSVQRRPPSRGPLIASQALAELVPCSANAINVGGRALRACDKIGTQDDALRGACRKQRHGCGHHGLHPRVARQFTVDHPFDDVGVTSKSLARFVTKTSTPPSAESAGRIGLSAHDVLMFCNLLSAAGSETTKKLISNSLVSLSEHPDQWKKVVEDQSLIPRAINESLRYDMPSHWVARTTTRDVELQIDLAEVWPCSSFRSATVTAAPSAASRCAMALPSPCAPPVTSALRISNRPMWQPLCQCTKSQWMFYHIVMSSDPASGEDEPSDLLESDGRVRTITLNRPDPRNAVNHEIHTAFTRLWPTLTDDADARAVDITDAGSFFSSGGDLVQWLENYVQNPVTRRAGMKEARRVVREMVEFPLPCDRGMDRPSGSRPGVQD
jgi:hypothetical protein